MSSLIQNTRYGLSLSNDLVCLLRKADGDVWVPVADVKTDDPDFETKVADLRQHVEKKHAKNPKVAVFIPFSEILFSFLKLPDSDLAAAQDAALSELEKQTPYAQEEIAFDLVFKPGRAVTPCATVAKATLKEAEEFVLRAGFIPTYYTAKRNAMVFAKEPVFLVVEEERATLPPVAMWGSAAAVAIALAVAGFWLFNPVNATTEQVESATPNVEQREQLVDLAPKLANLSIPSGFAAHSVLTETDLFRKLPSVETEPKVSFTPIKLAALETANDAFAEPVDDRSFVQVNFLTPASVEIDAQDVQTNDAAVLPIVSDLADNPLIVTKKDTAPTVQVEPVRLAALEPTIEGAVSPDGYSVFSGKPTVVPPNRGQSSIFLASLPAKPKLRPSSNTATIEELDPDGTARIESLVEDALTDSADAGPQTLETTQTVPNEEVEAPAEEELVIQTPSELENQTNLLDQANPELRAFKPKLRGGETATIAQPEVAPAEPEQTLPETEITQAPDETLTETDPIATNEPENSDEDATNLLALANPELRSFKPRLRGIEQAEVEPTELEIDLLALANPELRSSRAPARPSTLQSVPTPPDGLLALANPSLRGKTPAKRPSNLQVTSVEPEAVKPVEPEVVEPVVKEPTAAELEAERIRLETEKQQAELRRLQAIEQDRVRKQQLAEQELQRNLSTSSRLAVRKSPVPAKKSSRFSRSVQKTEQSIRTARLTPQPTRTTPSTKSTPSAKDSTFSKGKISLVGVYGTPSTRRALIRLPTGTFKRVKMGQRVSGWRVSAIGESTVRITKGSRNQTLRLP